MTLEKELQQTLKKLLKAKSFEARNHLINKVARLDGRIARRNTCRR